MIKLEEIMNRGYEVNFKKGLDDNNEVIWLGTAKRSQSELNEEWNKEVKVMGKTLEEVLDNILFEINQISFSFLIKNQISLSQNNSY